MESLPKSKGHRNAKYYGITKIYNQINLPSPRYFVKNPRSQGLHFQPSTVQSSPSSKGIGGQTSATYCKARFDHGVNPTGQKYQYTIEVIKILSYNG